MIEVGLKSYRKLTCVDQQAQNNKARLIQLQMFVAIHVHVSDEARLGKFGIRQESCMYIKKIRILPKTFIISHKFEHFQKC